MIRKKLMMKTFLFGPVLGAILSALIVAGCTDDAGHGDGRDSDGATVSQDISEREGGSSGGEHGSNGEGNESGEEGGDGSGEHGSGGDGGGESSEAAMSSPITPLGQSWHGVLGGLAVSMQYDAATQPVHGTVRNTLPLLVTWSSLVKPTRDTGAMSLFLCLECREIQCGLRSPQICRPPGTMERRRAPAHPTCCSFGSCPDAGSARHPA